MKQSIGDFLLRRLQEAGIQHIFGVPGDYNLEVMQQLEERGEPTGAGFVRVGSCDFMDRLSSSEKYDPRNHTNQRKKLTVIDQELIPCSEW